MNGFRQYLKQQEAEMDARMTAIKTAYDKGSIDTDNYIHMTHATNATKMMISTIEMQYERTHKIWE